MSGNRFWLTVHEGTEVSRDDHWIHLDTGVQIPLRIGVNGCHTIGVYPEHPTINDEHTDCAAATECSFCDEVKGEYQTPLRLMWETISKASQTAHLDHPGPSRYCREPLCQVVDEVAYIADEADVP